LCVEKLMGIASYDSLLHTTRNYKINEHKTKTTKNSPGDGIIQRDIALFCHPLAFNATDGGFPWDDLRKILHVKF